MRALLPVLVLLLLASLLHPQDPAAPQDPKSPIPSILLDTCDWRLVGPFRGGRVAAVTGVPGARDTYYMGSVGGGVWKTTDAGVTWKNVSDGFFGGSIGAVAVADSNHDIVYAGGGEKTWRGNVSSGDGMWKSTDAGTSWTFVGLSDSRHISRIRIDPKNDQRVFAAVMGHVSGPNEARGVYRSLDGGSTWERVLFANEFAGAVDLCFEPGDANVLYASTWRAQRLPHRFDSGGEGSALWKSTDGGTTWTDLSQKKGMPKGPLGIIGVCVSPADEKRVWAMVEAEDGGLFRSDDRGETFTRVNEERSLRQRAWYYSRCYADPLDKDVVYVLNVAMHKSTDGGATFTSISTPHSDNHDLWIDPKDSARMVEGNDGGACVSTNGGTSWSTQGNQPTAQFYRVTTDNGAPYRIYAAQQDNSAMRIRHRSRSAGIGREDFESTAGAESGWLAPKPDDPEVVFGGNYGGLLERRDHRAQMSRRVDVWPDNPLGAGADSVRYRFQWNFPILFSPHDKNLLYAAGNVLFVSRDEGQTWQAISGDLTRDDKERQTSSGGPITQDNTSVEYYCTIFAVAESPVQQGVIWCGSDDGLVHVTKDGGTNWQNVTPPELPEWTQINSLEADPFDAGTCYVAATRYKLDDFTPYLFVTRDFGASWQKITRGIENGWFVRCVRADPVKKGLLFAGTERTIWMSMDHGMLWQRFQRNLPLVPITDMCIRDGSLIAATQGRSIWSFDHLAHLRQIEPEKALHPVVLFEPVPHVQYPGGDEVSATAGTNPSKSPSVRVFVLGEGEEPLTVAAKLEIEDDQKKVVFVRDSGSEKDEDKLVLKPGMNRVAWEWKTEEGKRFDGMVLWNGNLSGPRAHMPGDYTVRLTFGDVVQTAVLRIVPDPRTPATVSELQDRHRFVQQCHETIDKAHTAIETIRSLRTQMTAVTARASGDGKTQLEQKQKEVADALTAVEEVLYQTKSKSGQDPLNYPIKLTDKLAGVMSAANGALFAPTAAQKAVALELTTAIEAELAKYEAVRADGVAGFNALARSLEVPYVK
ncbi:MAG: glycosyl hydrolase [Planctomycetota bacterium]